MAISLFVEVSPLLELAYTGVANVTAAVAEYWLSREDHAVYFMYGPFIIKKADVRRALRSRCGAVLRCQIANTDAIEGFVLDEVSKCGTTVALFTNVKTITGVFNFEFQIICDITFLLTPEFHHIDTITYHGYSLIADLHGNIHTYCISECTKRDLVTYIGVDDSNLTVSYPGVDRSNEFHVQPDDMQFGINLKLIIIPGTIEPRKNIEVVLKLLKSRPDLLRRYRFVFIGRNGWLTDFRQLLTSFDLIKHLQDGEIQWLNFVSDLERDALYRRAAMTIYPSFYEGFGLPIIEAMAAGCPVVASFSSSIPEAGGDVAFYFDPTSVISLSKAFDACESASKQRVSLSERCIKQASHFTWSAFNTKIANHMAAFWEHA